MLRPPVWLIIAAELASACVAPALFAQAEFTGERMPYSAFDQLPAADVKADGGTLHAAFAPGEFTLPKSALLSWIGKSARAVSIYYGRFPVPSARLLIVPVDGRGGRGGQAFGYRGAAVRLLVGRESTADDLVRDWKAVHEMIHLALPDVGEQHLWLSEGLAVYIESIARVQAGDLTPEKIWGEFVRDMPNGLPGPGDKGLDHTHSWGRTYWGGAMFCLLADIDIRKRTANTKGLQDAMRGVLAAGGNMEQDWEIERVLAAADKATGVPALSELYAKMRDTATAPDLDALWRDLGIDVRDGRVTFNDGAPLAAIRLAITTSPPAAKD